MTSETSVRAAAFVEGRLAEAQALGAALADLMGEPEVFVARLTVGLRHLQDPDYAAVQERVAPGSGMTIGVRWPLIHAVERALRAPLREASSSLALSLAQRLVAEPSREVRLFSLPCLRRTLPEEPERSWQLLRRIAHAARDWITVDSLADVYAQGVLAERFRWAELELLAYSTQRMERRLVGSTLARLPRVAPRSRRGQLDRAAALKLIASLMGDADDQVRKALSWALREWTRIDRPLVESFLDREAGLAVAASDGNRAWVIRDTLSHVSLPAAERLRSQLAGIRRKAGGPSTSPAGEAAAAFQVGALAERAVAQQGERFARGAP